MLEYIAKVLFFHKYLITLPPVSLQISKVAVLVKFVVSKIFKNIENCIESLTLVDGKGICIIFAD